MECVRSTFVVMVVALTAWSADTTSKIVEQYGMAQYRLRVKATFETPAGGDTKTGWNYYNQIGYYYGVKITPVQAFLLQVQIGDNWYATETVSWKTTPAAPRFNLAFAKWDPGFFNLSGGILPIQNNGALDLLSRSSVCEDNAYHTYAKAAYLGWGDATSNGLAGARLGAPVVKGDVSLSASLFSTVIESRQSTPASPSKPNPSSVLTVLDVPCVGKTFSVTGQVAALFNRNFNANTGKGDHEISGGVLATWQPVPEFSLLADAGAATVNNGSSGPATVTTAPQTFLDTATGLQVTRNVADTADAPAYRQLGVLAGIGASVKAGPGKIAGAFRYSLDENLAVAGSDVSYFLLDLKYGWDLTPNVSIMPRVRGYYTYYRSDARSEAEIRPEIILTGKF
jgi:hypothetical protein